MWVPPGKMCHSQIGRLCLSDVSQSECRKTRSKLSLRQTAYHSAQFFEEQQKHLESISVAASRTNQQLAIMSGRGKGGKGLGKGGAKRHRKVLRDNIQGEHTACSTLLPTVA